MRELRSSSLQEATFEAKSARDGGPSGGGSVGHSDLREAHHGSPNKSGAWQLPPKFDQLRRHDVRIEPG